MELCVFFFPKLKQFLIIELGTKRWVLVFLPQIVIHKNSSEVKYTLGNNYCTDVLWEILRTEGFHKIDNSLFICISPSQDFGFWSKVNSIFAVDICFCFMQSNSILLFPDNSTLISNLHSDSMYYNSLINRVRKYRLWGTNSTLSFRDRQVAPAYPVRTLRYFDHSECCRWGYGTQSDL